jgi:hypothetical protein
MYIHLFMFICIHKYEPNESILIKGVIVFLHLKPSLHMNIYKYTYLCTYKYIMTYI